MRQLDDAARVFLQSTCDENDTKDNTAADTLKAWLRDGICPNIHSGLSSVNVRSIEDFQLGLGGVDQELAAWVRERLECALCLGLLWEPTTIPCGHTVCRPCLARTLDHAFDTRPACPMCRKDLSPYLAWLNARAVAAGRREGLADGHGGAQIPVNLKIDAILRRHFQAETAERGEQIRSAEAAAGSGDAAVDTLVIPIFVCSMAMPAVACPLHIFEPRYRLMMRRCIESGQRQFGMCVCPTAKYGTMLRILQFEQLPDGRSRIQTIGTRRFEVLEWGTKDGYSTGRIAWVDDLEEEEPKDEAEQDATKDAAEDGREAPGSCERPVEPVLKSAKSVGSAISCTAQKLQEITDRLLSHAMRAGPNFNRLEYQLGPCPQRDGSDGPHCPAFVFWCAGLAQLPPRRAYELCYADEFRQYPSRRARAVLAHFERKVSALGQEGGLVQTEILSDSEDEM